jgi:hypothetical protein
MPEGIGIDLECRRELREAVQAFCERDLVDGEEPPLRAQLVVVDQDQRLQAIEEIGELVEAALEGHCER